MNLTKHSFFGVMCCALIESHAMEPDVKTRDMLVKDSYVVTFKNSTAGRPSPVWPGKRVDPSEMLRNIPIGGHNSGQSKVQLSVDLGLRGQVNSIYDMINAAHLLIEPDEAERLLQDPRVLRVEQNRIMSPTQSVQMNPGWALDRLDQPTTALDYKHIYNSTGVGEIIYILDTGLTVANPGVQAEFGTRATMAWDVNAEGGIDCVGHCTNVASVAAGNQYGIAKGATVRAAKVTVGCGYSTNTDTIIFLFNWLAANASRGTIANLNYGFEKGFSCPTTPNNPAYTFQALDDSIIAAHNAGTIVVVSAGNDDCDTAYFSPTRIPQAFVVGATSSSRFNQGQDAKSPDSRIGANVSAYAPGVNVPTLDSYGNPTFATGTSIAAPFLAGLFAAGCPVLGTFCKVSTVADIYARMRSIGVMGTVVMDNGSPLPAGTASRFVNRGPW